MLSTHAYRKAPAKYSWCFILSVFIFLQMFGASSGIDRAIYGEFARSSKFNGAVNLISFLAGLTLLLRGLSDRKGIGTGGILAILTGVFFLFSAVWSIAPDFTIRRSIFFLLSVISTIGIAINLDADEFINSLSLTCFLSVIASIVALVASPHVAITPDGQALRGIFGHKNMFGQVVAAGVFATLHRMRSGRTGRLRGLFALLLYAITAYYSRSGTSLLIIFALCIIGPIISLYQTRGISRLFGISISLVLIPIFVMVAWNADSFLELIGKDPTLTGRTDLWGLVMAPIQERLLLGWGFNAFWLPGNPAAGRINDTLGWVVPEAHNGLLEMLLQVGAIGTALLVFLWLRNVSLALRCLQTTENNFAISALLCCGWIVMTGISELVLVDFASPSTSVFFISGLICERILRTRRSRKDVRRNFVDDRAPYGPHFHYRRSPGRPQSFTHTDLTAFSTKLSND
jgi:exopolysaccharide production protein ExoQ